MSAFHDQFPPRDARAHEATGPGAAAFAAILCGMAAKPALWITESWQAEMLNPAGLAEFCDPRKVLMARAGSPIDVLASAEEALRSGAVGLVVAEVTRPLTLTAGRRLQLAAEAGRTRGLFLIPEGGGSNAAETRWHCAPAFSPQDSTLRRWELIKNKSGTLGAWSLRWDDKAHRIIVVSEAGE